MQGERSVLVEKRALLRELGCKDPGRALVTLLLLPILFQGAGVARVSLRYADCSSLAYALATHMAKRDTHLQMAALDALESLFPFARLLAHDEGCQCCLPAHPWLTRVLVLGSLDDKDCIRLLDLMLDNDCVNEELVKHLATFTNKIFQDGSSQAKSVAAKLLSGVYNGRLGAELQGRLRLLLSTCKVAVCSAPPARARAH